MVSYCLIFPLVFGSKQTDFHLHCKEWDELLENGNWEPEAIVKKLPEFFHFVKKIQRCVIHEMNESGSAKTGKKNLS